MGFTLCTCPDRSKKKKKKCGARRREALFNFQFMNVFRYFFGTMLHRTPLYHHRAIHRSRVAIVCKICEMHTILKCRDYVGLELIFEYNKSLWSQPNETHYKWMQMGESASRFYCKRIYVGKRKSVSNHFGGKTRAPEKRSERTIVILISNESQSSVNSSWAQTELYFTNRHHWVVATNCSCWIGCNTQNRKYWGSFSYFKHERDIVICVSIQINEQEAELWRTADSMQNWMWPTLITA